MEPFYQTSFLEVEDSSTVNSIWPFHLHHPLRASHLNPLFQPRMLTLPPEHPVSPFHLNAFIVSHSWDTLTLCWEPVQAPLCLGNLFYLTQSKMTVPTYPLPTRCPSSFGIYFKPDLSPTRPLSQLYHSFLKGRAWVGNRCLEILIDCLLDWSIDLIVNWDEKLWLRFGNFHWDPSVLS